MGKNKIGGDTHKPECDLHMHTTHSADASSSVGQVLGACERAGLEIISITDHDTVGAYGEIEKGIFSGRIIPGIEITCVCCGNAIEILGYGIDTAKMAPLIAGALTVSQKRRKCVDTVVERMRAKGLFMPDASEFKSWPECYEYIVAHYKGFLESVNPQFTIARANFYRGGVE